VVSRTALEDQWVKAGRPLTFNNDPRVRLVQFLEVAFVRGVGTEADPVRQIRRYYSQDGYLVFEEPDPFPRTSQGATG
jgi:hypothetical protein